MMAGKAISRALRGYFLVEATLVNKLMLKVLPYAANENETVNPREESELQIKKMPIYQVDICNIGTAITSVGITMEAETLEDENWAACNDLAVEDMLDVNM